MTKRKWKTDGLEGLLEIASERINPWVATAIDEAEASFASKRVVLRALWEEYNARKKHTWHWKDWYKDLITDSISKEDSK